MKRNRVTVSICVCILANLTLGLAGEKIMRELTEGEPRDSLADRFEKIRGDSGKWRDEALLQVSPPMAKQMSLDAWADSLPTEQPALSAKTDTWVLYRTEQLDDNDRLWIESVSREANLITVTFQRATWQGYYSKNFTWYGAWAVNLGNLEAGAYEVQWVVRPLVFRQFVDPKKRRDSWPGEVSVDPERKPWSESVQFTVAD